MGEQRRSTDRITNLYEYLQVTPRAEASVIQAAYRALARRYHPDITTSANGARAMREINAAYHVLSDPERRARYDAHRARLDRASGARRTAAARRRAADAAADPRIGVTPFISVQRTPGAPGSRPILATVTLTLLVVCLLCAAVLLLADAMDDGPTSDSALRYDADLSQARLMWPMDRLGQTEVHFRR